MTPDSKTIDCEVRTLLTAEQFQSMKDFFAANAELKNEDTQETRYFAGEHDLRIQKTQHRAKIWLKEAGAFSDRNEIAINVSPTKFDAFAELFSTLGYETAIIWVRHRKTYLWEGINVSIDDTKGFGQVLELKKSCDEEWRLETMEVLRTRLTKLGLKPTPKPQLAERFGVYRANWKELLAEAIAAEKAAEVATKEAAEAPKAVVVEETPVAQEVQVPVTVIRQIEEAEVVATVAEVVEIADEVPAELESVMAPVEEVVAEEKQLENAPA